MPGPFLIGQFNDSFKPIMDGVALCAENYTRWLDEKYGTAFAIVPHVPRFIDDDSFTVVRYPSLPIPGMPPYRLGLPWASPMVNRLLSWTNFDLVHSHSPWIAGRMAERVARRHDVPHVSTFHTKYRDDIARFVKSRRMVQIIINRMVRFYERCDAVWSPSEATAETLREYGYHGPVIIAPNGSDFDRPEPAAQEAYREASRDLVPWPDDRFVFLFVGQHRWEKNVELVIRSVARLREMRRAANVGLVFAGEGYAAEDMKALVNELRIQDVTLFLGRIVDRERLKSLFARAQLFLFPSLYDNAPLVMREAAAFFVPTVVAEGSSAAEIVADGENGFVVANDPEKMARALGALVRRPERVSRAGENASQSIYRGWEEIVDWAAGEYEQLIRTRRQSG